MTARKSKNFIPDLNPALAQLSQLPKVGGLGGYDIALGFSHRYALEIAAETLADTPENVTNDILDNMYDIFDQWQYEYGVYPPNPSGLLGFRSRVQERASDYCERIALAAELAGEEPKLPQPWECCPFVTTRLGLFWKLMSDEYQPLKKYLEKKWSLFEKIIAVLILLTNKRDSEYQSSDCIESALKLASFKLSMQDSLIKQMKPDFETAFKRRKHKKLSTKSKKEEKERQILSAYVECHKEYGEGKLPNKVVAARAGIPEPTVCRYLRKAGLGRYKTK